MRKVKLTLEGLTAFYTILALLGLGFTLLSCDKKRPSEPEPLPMVSPSPEPSPIPLPTIPDECPPLVKWGVALHNVMNDRYQQVPFPVVNGFVVLDSTPRFGSGNGAPCNAEHHTICSLPGAPEGVYRKCEDPRGGAWRILEGPAEVNRIQLPGPDTGFQARLHLLTEGKVVVEVCPLPDLRDGEEPPKRVEIGPAPCGRVEFEVGRE